MAETAAHVTMLQRSPSYLTVLPEPRRGRRPRCAGGCRPGCAHRLVRAKNIAAHAGLLPARPAPPGAGEEAAARPRGAARSATRRTSTSTSPPATTRGTSGCAWSRTATCIAAHHGRRGRRWSPTTSTGSCRTGIRLRSGRVLEADIVVSATGLSLLPFGGMRADRGRRSRSTPAQPVAYRGLMLSGVPNLAYLHRLHQRLLDAARRPVPPLRAAGCSAYMDRHGYAVATPTRAPRRRPAPAARPDLRVRAARRWTGSRSRATATRGGPPELPADVLTHARAPTCAGT